MEKNIRNLTGKDYVENMEKQRAFLEELTEQLEERIEEVLGMKGKIRRKNRRSIGNERKNFYREE